MRELSVDVGEVEGVCPEADEVQGIALEAGKACKRVICENGGPRGVYITAYLLVMTACLSIQACRPAFHLLALLSHLVGSGIAYFWDEQTEKERQCFVGY